MDYQSVPTASDSHNSVVSSSSQEDLTFNNEWILGFCVVTFDLELGQKLEFSYPSHQFDFNESEINNICFSSFPDSNANLSGDTVFSFRHKKSTENPKKFSFVYGHVFFRQEKDATIHRGYLQKSVVLISRHPYLALFKAVIECIGPLFFQYGNPLLEACFQNTATWPKPVPGMNFELPLLGNIFSFHLPFSGSPNIIDPQQKTVISAAPKETLVSNLQSINIHKSFADMVDKLWTLWELVLLNEPILVLSPTPSQSSQAVLGLVSLISPLTYGGDFRPYFTIHDTDFKGYTQNPNKTKGGSSGSNPSSVLPSVILGVTNPFFCKALEHWPHILKIGEPPENKRTSGSSRKGTNPLISDFKQELTTKFRRLNGFDKSSVMQQLTKGDDEKTNISNNETLRKHFYFLTEDFLIPLERYFASLMPLMKTVSIFRKPPSLKTFDEEEFIATVISSKKGLMGGKKNNEIDLYTRFLKSSNFRIWFNTRRREALKILNSNYEQIILQADIPALVKDRNEIEIVDLYMRIYDQLEITSKKSPKSVQVIETLEEHLVSILKFMPEDLQCSIQKQEKSKQIFTIDDQSDEETQVIL